MARGKKKKLTEYKNCTTHDIWVEKGWTESRPGRPVKVPPDGSVFLTEEDIAVQKEEYRATDFIDGSIREVSSDMVSPEDINVRDDMSEAEIKLVVENLRDSRDLTYKLKRISSIATAERFLKECELQDRPISFLKACLKRVDMLQESLKIDYRKKIKEKRRAERDISHKETKSAKEKLSIEEDETKGDTIANAK